MANNNETDVLLNVKINVDDKIAALAATKQQITELKDAQKLLDQRTEEGRKQYEAYATQIRELNSTAKSQQKEIDNTIKAEKSAKDSVEQLKAKLQLLTEQYNKLSASEKEAAKGQEMASKIKGINEQLTESSKQTGGFSGKLAEMAESMKGATSGFGGLLSVFGKFAPGIGIATTAFEAVKNVMESTRGAMNQFKAAMEGVSSAWDYMLSSFTRGNLSISGITSAFNAGAQGKIDDVRNKDQQASFKVIEARTQGEVQELLDQMGQTRDKAKKAEIGKKAKELIVSAANQKEKLLDKQTTDDFKKYYEKTGLTRDDLQELYNFEAEIDPELLSFIKSTSKADLQKKITPKELKKIFSGQKTTLEPKDYSQSDNLQTLRYLQLSEKRDLLKDEQKDKLDEDLKSYYEVKAEKYASIKKLDKLITNSEAAVNQQQKQALQKKYQDELKSIQEHEAEIAERKSPTAEAQKQNYLEYEKWIDKEKALYRKAAKEEVITTEEKATNIRQATKKLNEFTLKTYEQRLAELDKRDQNITSSPSTSNTDDEMNANIQKKKDIYNEYLDIYGQMLDGQKITQDEYDENVKKKDNDFAKYYQDQIAKRVKTYSDGLDSEAAFQKLKDENEIAGTTLTLSKQHELEVKALQDDEALRVKKLEKQKEYLEGMKKIFPEFSSQIDSQIAEIESLKKTIHTDTSIKVDTSDKNYNKKKNDKDTADLIESINQRIELAGKGTLKEAKLKNQILETQRKKEIDDLNEQQKQELSVTDLTEKQKAEIKDKYSKKISLTNDVYAKKEADNTIDSVVFVAREAQSTLGELNNYLNAQDQKRITSAEDTSSRRKSVLSDELSSGLITQKQYNKQVKAEEEALAAKKRKIAHEEAVRNKALSIANITIDVAEGIAKSLKTPALIPWIAALGAAKLALAIATPIPAAARGMFVRKSNGGLLNGRSHAQGGIPIEAEGGEAIINKRSTAMYKPLLSAINEAGGGVKFASGGVVGAYLSSQGITDTRFTNDGGYSARKALKDNTDIEGAMARAVSKVKVYTTVEDYRKADTNYTNIVSSGTV